MAEHLTQLGAPVAAVDRVIARAEGNAYFAEELLAASAGGTELPTALADLLVARTVDLSETAQQVLRAAAVTGRRIDDDLVMRAAGPDRSRLRGRDQGGGVPAAAGARWHGRAAFRHALLREAIYNDLLPGERTRLHARLAELLDAGRVSGRDRHAQPGQSRHPRRVYRLGAGR